MCSTEEGSRYAERLAAELRAELTCSLCERLFDDPCVLPNCQHVFCRACVEGTLEGTGVVKSECPACHQPVWKNELTSCPKYASLAVKVRDLEHYLRTKRSDPHPPGPTAAFARRPSEPRSSQECGTDGKTSVVPHRPTPEPEPGGTGAVQSSKELRQTQRSHGTCGGASGGGPGSNGGDDRGRALSAQQHQHHQAEADSGSALNAGTGRMLGCTGAPARRPEQLQQMAAAMGELNVMLGQAAPESKNDEPAAGAGDAPAALAAAESWLECWEARLPPRPAIGWPRGREVLDRALTAVRTVLDSAEEHLRSAGAAAHGEPVAAGQESLQAAAAGERGRAGDSGTMPLRPGAEGDALRPGCGRPHVCLPDSEDEVCSLSGGVRPGQEAACGDEPAGVSHGSAGLAGDMQHGRQDGQENGSASLSRAKRSNGGSGRSDAGLACPLGDRGPLAELQPSAGVGGGGVVAAEAAAGLQGTGPGEAGKRRRDAAMLERPQPPGHDAAGEAAGGAAAPPPGAAAVPCGCGGDSGGPRPGMRRLRRKPGSKERRRRRALPARETAAAAQSAAGAVCSGLRRRRQQQAALRAGARRHGGGAAAGRPQGRAEEGERQGRGGADVGGAGLVGRRVRVFWPQDDAWYCGTVARYNARSRRHQVRYDDGDLEQLDLCGQEVWDWLSSSSPSCSPAKAPRACSAHGSDEGTTTADQLEVCGLVPAGPSAAMAECGASEQADAGLACEHGSAVVVSTSQAAADDDGTAVRPRGLPEPAETPAASHAPVHGIVLSRKAGIDRQKLQMLCNRSRGRGRGSGPFLAGSVADGVTHLVVPVAGDGRAQRTLKYMQALARSCWVVQPAWALACFTAGAWVDAEPFLVLGDTTRDGAPRRVVLGPPMPCPSSAPLLSRLLSGIQVWLLAWPDAPDSGMSRGALEELLRLCGGRVLLRQPPAAQLEAGTVVVLAPDLHQIEPAVREDWHGRTVTSCSWVFDSLSACSLQPRAGYESLVKGQGRQYGFLAKGPQVARA